MFYRLKDFVWAFALLLGLLAIPTRGFAEGIAKPGSTLAVIDFFNLSDLDERDSWEALFGRGLRRSLFTREDVVIVRNPRVIKALDELDIDTHFITAEQVPPIAEILGADQVVLGSFNVEEGVIASSIKVVDGKTGEVAAEDIRFGYEDRANEFLSDLESGLHEILFGKPVEPAAPEPTAVPLEIKVITPPAEEETAPKPEAAPPSEVEVERALIVPVPDPAPAPEPTKTEPEVKVEVEPEIEFVDVEALEPGRQAPVSPPVVAPVVAPVEEESNWSPLPAPAAAPAREPVIETTEPQPPVEPSSAPPADSGQVRIQGPAPAPELDSKPETVLAPEPISMPEPEPLTPEREPESSPAPEGASVRNVLDRTWRRVRGVESPAPKAPAESVAPSPRAPIASTGPVGSPLPPASSLSPPPAPASSLPPVGSAFGTPPSRAPVPSQPQAANPFAPIIPEPALQTAPQYGTAPTGPQTPAGIPPRFPSPQPQTQIGPIRTEARPLPPARGPMQPQGPSPFRPMQPQPTQAPQNPYEFTPPPLGQQVQPQPQGPPPGPVRRVFSWFGRKIKGEPAPTRQPRSAPPAQQGPVQEAPEKKKFLWIFDRQESKATPLESPGRGELEQDLGQEREGDSVLLAGFPTRASVPGTDALVYRTEPANGGIVEPRRVIREDPPRVASNSFALGPQSMASLGQEYFEAGNFDLAEDSFEKALKQDPNNADLAYNLAQVRLAMGDDEGAITSLERAAITRPDDASTLGRLGALYAEKGEWGKSVDTYTRLALANPDDAKTFYRLGKSFVQVGDSKQAIRAYKKALSLDPRDADSAREISAAYLRMDERKKAKDYFHLAQRIDSTEPRLARLAPAVHQPGPSKHPLRGTLFTQTN